MSVYSLGEYSFSELIKKYKTQGSLLDIGCSVGIFLKIAKQDGWETYGLEISKDTAKLARKRYGLEVLVGSLHQTNFEPDSFDVVTIIPMFSGSCSICERKSTMTCL